jgi:DNA polymerase III delta' subunit
VTRAVALAPPGGIFHTRGHGLALRVVARAIEAVRPPHALLLVGPRGVGKTTLALDLAAGLQCEADEPRARPCRRCAACRKVASGNHVDLHLLEPEGAGEQIRIGAVQALVTELSLSAAEGRFRVAIICAAHRLNVDAQNALLKTLEEPGQRTCLMLCADDAAPLLPTVISRAARLHLSALPIEDLVSLLVEERTAQPAHARAAAIAAGGCPGLAIRLSEHPQAVLARSRISHVLLETSDQTHRFRLGAAAELMEDGAMFDAALRGEPAPASRRLQPVERRRAVRTVLEVWRDLGRDLAVAAFGRGTAVHDRDQLEALVALGGRIDRSELRAFLDRLDTLLLAVDGYASPELVLDQLLLAWPRPAPSAEEAA